VKGKEAVAAFYDKNIGPSTIVITTHESYAAEANESAHVMTLDTTLSNGVKTKVRGIFTYRTNDEGRITNLRGYWTMAVMEFEQPT
jgi:steroid delta-isomerase